MSDIEKVKFVFSDIGIGYKVEGTKIVIDDFEIDGQTNEVVISFFESGKYQEFRVYPKGAEE